MARVFATSVIAFVVWLAVTWSTNETSLLIGAGASLAMGFLLRGIELEAAPLALMPHRLFWAIVYVPVLLWLVLKANVDVAWRVIHPKMPIRPGIVKVKTTLRTAAGRVLLANSVTLTPGTFTVDLVDDTLYIHWIAVPEKDPEGVMLASIRQFEVYIRRILE